MWKGGRNVKKKIIERLADRSDENSFCSALRCESCGKIWVSQRVKFSKENVAPVTEGKKVVFSILYERELEQAQHLTISIFVPSAERWFATTASSCVKISICVKAVRRGFMKKVNRYSIGRRMM